MAWDQIAVCGYCGGSHPSFECTSRTCEGGDTPDWLRPPSHKADAPQPLTGGSSDYYKLQIDKPTSGGDPYTAECNDIIEALQMTYAEGNVFKAVWRHALARRGVGKKGNTLQYEADKVAFFGERLAELAKD